MGPGRKGLLKATELDLNPRDIKELDQASE